MISHMKRRSVPIVISDDFDRANSSNLGADYWEAGGGNVSITSNRIAGAGSGPDYAFHHTALTNDHYVEWDVITGAGMSFMLRVNPDNGAPSTAGFDAYEWFWTTASGGTWTLRKWINGAVSVISTFTGKSTPNGTRMRFEAIGTALNVFRDGVSQVATTDASIANGQRIGVRLDNSGLVLDNMAAGSI